MKYEVKQVNLYQAIQKYFPALEKLFDNKTLEDFLHCSHDERYLYHLNLGTWIRNNLLKDKALVRLFHVQNIWHKDDMSTIMIEQLHIYVQEKHRDRLTDWKKESFWQKEDEKLPYSEKTMDQAYE